MCIRDRYKPLGVNSSVVSQNERDIDILDNEKFVVYEGMFDKLFSIVLCEKCFQRVLTKLRKASWEQASISSYTVQTIILLLIGKVNLCLEKCPLSTFSFRHQLSSLDRLLRLSESKPSFLV